VPVRRRKVLIRELARVREQLWDSWYSREESRLLGYHHLGFFYLSGSHEWLQRKRPV